MSLLRKASIAAIGGSATLVGLTAVPAFAVTGTYSGQNPYPIPQSSPGVPNSTAESITITGETPGAHLFAALCDGVAVTDTAWSGATGADCGPWGSAVTVDSTGKAVFQLGNIALFHGDDQTTTNPGNPGNIDVGFNCLAPDDHPGNSVTTQGNQIMDPAVPAYGDTAGNVAGGNPNNSATYPGGTGDPCQIEIVSGAPAPTTWNAGIGDVAIPVDETEIVGTAAPESPVTIALPIGAATLLGGGAAVAIRRRRRSAAA